MWTRRHPRAWLLRLRSPPTALWLPVGPARNSAHPASRAAAVEDNAFAHDSGRLGILFVASALDQFAMVHIASSGLVVELHNHACTQAWLESRRADPPMGRAFSQGSAGGPRR